MGVVIASTLSVREWATMLGDAKMAIALPKAGKRQPSLQRQRAAATRRGRAAMSCTDRDPLGIVQGGSFLDENPGAILRGPSTAC